MCFDTALRRLPNRQCQAIPATLRLPLLADLRERIAVERQEAITSHTYSQNVTIEQDSSLEALRRRLPTRLLAPGSPLR